MKIIKIDELLRLANFDAASKTYRNQGFGSTKTAGINNLTTELTTLMQRSRYLIDNNAYARNAMRIVSHNTIKNGIKFKFDEPESPLSNAFKRWADVNKLNQLQLLAIKTIFTSGSVLIRKIKRRSANDVAPLSLQILEPDYINLTKHSVKLKNGGFILAGKEFNSKKEIVAYHLYKNHPANTSVYHVDNYQTERVKSDDILHVYDVYRPDQLHGVPMLASALTRLANYDEYCDAKLEQQKIATFLALIIKGNDNINLGVNDEDDNKNELSKETKMQPGMIAGIGNNDISVVSPPNASESDNYAKSVIREIAAAIGITYEQLANDYSQVNFSSAKMGRIEFKSNVAQWQSMIIDQLLNPIYTWFLNALEVAGVNVNSINVNVNVDWIAPAVANVDEEKEAKSYREMIRNGLMTQSEAVRLLGRDADKFFENYAKDLAELDKNKIILDTDARKTARGGTLQNAE